VLGTRVSPYLQELLVLAGVSDVYAAAPALLERLLRIAVSTSTVYRVTRAVGEALPAEALLAPVADTPLYLQVDGSLLLTDSGWQEVKVGRVFARDAITGEGDLATSQYCAVLGGHAAFEAQLEALVPATRDVVFLSDGARWIEQWADRTYPSAVKILDFYHVVEHLAAAVQGLPLPGGWLEQQRALLLESQAEQVLTHVAQRPDIVPARLADLQAYYRHNHRRMDYAAFRAKGYAIGSGAIEAAHKTLIQTRMKRSGQRWNPQHAPAMLKLRVACKSNKTHLITAAITNA
jgi:hypothetical protein